MPEPMRQEASRLMRNFLNDNTSPETTSFHIVSGKFDTIVGRAGRARGGPAFSLHLAADVVGQPTLRSRGKRTARARLSRAGAVGASGRAISRASPTRSIASLFMSPCLSGWSDGEAKYQYMHLCHQVLSRSQLNAVAKLREAGIIANDLIVLPSLSNVSLANNGIHISMGSRLLDRRLRTHDQYVPSDEKQLGRSGYQNLRTLPRALRRDLYSSSLSHRVRSVSSRAAAVVPAARAGLHTSATAVARVEGKSAAPPVRTSADAVRAALNRRPDCKAVQASRRLRSRRASADVSRGLACNRAFLRTRWHGGQYSAAFVGAG